MDEDRRIRFMVAPLLFLASLVWGFVGDPDVHLAAVLPAVGDFNLKDASSLIAAAAAGGLAVFVLGFVIGTLTYVLLRFSAWILNKVRHAGSGCHEVVLSRAAQAAVWRLIKMPGEPRPEDEHFAGVTFDHDVLSSQHSGIHRWLMRRWNAFSVAATSITAIVLSLGFGHAFFGIRCRADWDMFALAVCALLVVSAILAWQDTMRMVTFQAERLAAGGTSPSSEPTQAASKPVAG